MVTVGVVEVSFLSRWVPHNLHLGHGVGSVARTLANSMMNLALANAPNFVSLHAGKRGCSVFACVVLPS